MSIQDEEYPLDSFLDLEVSESRRWLTGLIWVAGLAAFVGIAWYVYKPNLSFIHDLTTSTVLASAVPIAAIQPLPGVRRKVEQGRKNNPSMASANHAVDAQISIDRASIDVGISTAIGDGDGATVATDVGAVTVAKIVASTAEFVGARTEAGVVAPVGNPAAIPEKSRAGGPAKEVATLVEPAALLTNRDEVDNLSVTSLVQPKHGSLVPNGDGTFTYKPDIGYAGVDSFSYTVTVYHWVGFERVGIKARMGIGAAKSAWTERPGIGT